MPSDTLPHPDIMPLPGPRLDSPMKNATHFDYSSYESDQMIFGPLDLEDVNSLHISTDPRQCDSYADVEPDVKPTYGLSPLSAMAHFEFDAPQPFSNGAFYDSGGVYNPTEDTINSASPDPDLDGKDSPSSPIPRPSLVIDTKLASFTACRDPFLPDTPFWPTTFAALHPLPRSFSPSSPYEDAQISSWAEPSAHQTQNLIRPSVRDSPLTDASTLGQHTQSRRSSVLSGQLFKSSSAPSHTDTLVPAMTRAYSKRDDSASVPDDRGATVRRRKRSLKEETPDPSTGKEKPVLGPPRPVPSTWQLYFADWIKKQQSSGTRKLNIAQAEKEAGREYTCLSGDEKEPYKRRSQAIKEAREKEHEAYMRTLTPEDTKLKRNSRASQRKARKLRKSNIKGPNASTPAPSAGKVDDTLSPEMTSMAHDVSGQASPVNFTDMDPPSDLKQGASMVQGTDINISGGKLTNVAGDYHEHNTTVVVNNSEKSTESLGFLKGAFSKLDSLISILQRKVKEEDNDACGTMAESDSERANSNLDRSNQNEFHFNSLNDPPPATSSLDEEYLIYQTSCTNINDPTRPFAHSGPFPPTSNPHNSYPYGNPILTSPLVHYLPCWLPSWGGWISSWIAWVSPPSWIWPSFA